MLLVIANKLYSSWSLRPWILMRELGIPFDEEVIPLRRADTKARILARSGAGKCPVLIDGDVTVWESLAIAEYLAEKFASNGVWPADEKARAHARAASNEMHAGFQPLRAACPMNLGKRFASRDFGPDVAASVARLEDLWREARTRFGSKAGGPFLYGPFMAADAMFAPVVTRLDTYQIAVAADTRAYMNAILATAAFHDWKAGALAEPRDWDIPEYEEGHTAVEVFKR
jgi:glutathione S-transferase